MRKTGMAIPVVPLGDVLVDSRYGTSKAGSPSASTPVVGIPHVRDGKVRLTGMSRVDVLEEERNRLALRPGDILVIRTNGNRELVGQTGLVEAQTDAVFASYLVRFRVDTRRVEPAYLNHWMNSPAGRREVRRVITEAGQANVNPTEIQRHVRVPLPPLAEQKRIVAALLIWDLAVERSDQLIELKLSSREWLTRELLISASAGPRDEVAVEAVARIRSGSTPSKSRDDFWGGRHPWVSARDLKGWVLTDSVAGLTDEGYSVATVAPKDSVLILTRGMTLFKDVPVCMAGREMAFNQDVKALVVEASTNPKYVGLYLRSHRNDLLGLVDSAGHGTGRLDTDELRQFKIMMPPRSVQDWIVGVVEVADQEIRLLRRMNAALRQTRSALVSSLLGASWEQ